MMHSMGRVVHMLGGHSPAERVEVTWVALRVLRDVLPSTFEELEANQETLTLLQAAEECLFWCMTVGCEHSFV